MLKRLLVPAYVSVVVVSAGAAAGAALGCGSGEEETTICVAAPEDGGKPEKCPNVADAGVCPPGCEAEVV